MLRSDYSFNQNIYLYILFRFISLGLKTFRSLTTIIKLIILKRYLTQLHSKVFWLFTVYRILKYLIICIRIFFFIYIHDYDFGNENDNNIYMYIITARQPQATKANRNIPEVDFKWFCSTDYGFSGNKAEVTPAQTSYNINVTFHTRRYSTSDTQVLHTKLKI